jgi:hypothetical protein
MQLEKQIQMHKTNQLGGVEQMKFRVFMILKSLNI